MFEATNKRSTVMENETQINWLAWALGGLTLLLLAGGLYYRNQHLDLLRQNDRVGLRADSLLSVKLQLEGDISRLNDRLATTETDNTTLKKRVEEADQRLARSNQNLLALRRANSNRLLTARQLNEQITTLTRQGDSLGNQMAAMREKIGWMTDSNTVIAERNDQLNQRLLTLNETLLTMAPRSALTADNFRVVALKQNEKETAKAKKAHTLTVSFNVPAELNLDGQQPVLLSLTDRQGNAAMPPLRTTTVNLRDSNEVVPVHAEQTATFGPHEQRITFRLTPTDLKPGLYRAAVYTKKTYLGSVEFQFRDSFWFF